MTDPQLQAKLTTWARTRDFVDDCPEAPDYIDVELMRKAAARMMIWVCMGSAALTVVCGWWA